MIRIFCMLAALWATGLAAQERAPNHLQGAQSPYLLQHLYNPVDWYPWGDEALARARDENKLIFVSVGYASCHWCHVMREESFENPEVAAVLNRYFVSIKVDREVRPDLDEQFMLATQVIAGAGGWPNNLILTPLGDPVFGGTYFPPDALIDLLQQVQALWQENPAALTAEGFRMAQYLKTYLTRQAAAVALTPARLARIHDAWLGQMDVFNGGLGTAPKFPQEQVFLALLDAAERGADPELLAPVAALLDGMIAGGIHDQVGGGFHRYATDPAWQLPHFEKMLYNQANIGLLLARTAAATGRPSHARALNRLLAYLLTEMRGGGGFYAGQDADSPAADGVRREGAFYLWTPTQIIDALGPEDGAWVNSLFDVSEAGDLDGGNILHLGAETPDPARLDRLLAVLRDARARRPAPYIDRKILMGWNGATIAMLAEVGFLTGRDELWQIGAETARQLLDQLRRDHGFRRMIFDGRALEPAQLPDLAAFALGLIALHDYAPEGEARAPWLAEARDIAEILRTGFGSLDEGLHMVASPRGFSPIIAVDDGELASGNAMALRVLTRLSRRMEAPELAIDAHRLAAALSGFAAELPTQRAAALAAVRELEQGETGPLRHVSGGAVRVEMRRGTDTVEFTLTMKPGWHVNAHVPLEEYFVPTELTLAGVPLPAQSWPAPAIKALGFTPRPLALYEGKLHLSAPLPGTLPAQARLVLQACSDEICLEPEELTFTLW